MAKNTANRIQAVRALTKRAVIMAVALGAKKTENIKCVTNIHKSRKAVKKMDDIEELTDVEVEALKSLGPIFHYFGAWKPYLINARAKNGLFFGDYWTIEETGQDIMYLGDELLFKRLPIKKKQ